MVENLKGWLPVDAVVAEDRPGLSWLEMPDVPLAEPFFQETVDRARSQNGRRELFTEFDTLLQLEKTLDTVPPTGFIFHASRCGSTLVSNACRAITNSIVLSEPPALDKLIARLITDAAAHSPRSAIYSALIRALVHVLAQRRNGDERHLFIKFACCSFSQIDRIRRIWPNVPWLFLYRDPIETIVSNITNVPPWLLDSDRRVLASITNTSTTEVASMSLEELCARTIGSLYSTADRLANDGGMLLNYNQLSVPVISSVLKFFNINPSSDELETITRTSCTYSKETSRAFIADAETKQQQASALVREAAAAWAIEPYRRLEEKRMGNHE
ncbi:MAG TPA: hypothetical protein VFR78_19605 [Pyrinomonadaceae bacterium]|nr:hypothetical protein [Pyrinomonadaceae bacterium]